MKSFKWFLSLHYTLLRNSYWKNKATLSRTFTGLLIIGAVLYGLTEIFYRSLFNQLEYQEGFPIEIVFFLFLIVVLWIFLMSFIQSISGFTKTFYQSPEMNYLVSLPIPLNHLFLYNFVKHVFSSNKTMLILVIPFLVSIGMFINAPIHYYVLILPIYFFIAIIPSGLGVMAALLGSRLFSSQMFSLIVTFLSFAINIAFALSFTRADTLMTRFSDQIERIFESNILSDLVPITSGARVFLNITSLETYPLAILSLFGFTLLVVIVGFMLAKHHYFAGWEKSQMAISKVISTKKNHKAKETDLNQFQLIAHWIKHEWKMASRNFDMFIAAFSMLSFYLLASLAFTFGRLFEETPLIGISTLITLATLFNIMAVSLPFLPSDISKDKSLWKSRYWLLKVMPLKSENVLMIQATMYFIPAAIISLIGLLAYTIAIGLSFTAILASSLILLILLYGASLIYVSTELLSLNEYFEKNAMLGNLMTFVVPFGFAFLTAGVITLFFAEEFIEVIPSLHNVISYLTLPLVLAFVIVIFCSAMMFSIRSYITGWEKLEL